MTGLSVLVTEKGKIIFEKNLGYKDLSKSKDVKNKIKPGDLFRIASISKTFISTVLFKLAESGKINFCDDAQNYLNFPLRNPHFPDIPITIGMLMSHTSTINDSLGYTSLDVLNMNKPKYNKKVFLNEKPGTKYKYSNLNYNLLGAIIENATNKRFDNVIEEYIIRPLNLKGGYNLTNLDKSKFVKLYNYNWAQNNYIESTTAYKNYFDDENYQLGFSTTEFLPCGGMKISAKDLATFMNMLINYGEINGVKVISKESVQNMETDFKNNNTNYGMGIAKYKNIISNKTLYGATGRALGLNSAMIFDRSNNIGFIIISSGSTSIYTKGMNQIHKPIIREFYKLINQK